MRHTHILLVVLCFASHFVYGTNAAKQFVDDIITTWSQCSPTIIIAEHAPYTCFEFWWNYPCLMYDLGVEFELAKQLSKLLYGRGSNSFIFLGTGHTQLLSELMRISPSHFTSECPAFMPREYFNETRLRLDSNILFYHHDEGVGEYHVEDIFAIKGGTPITLELGKWNALDGFRFQSSLNRWDRRVDLEGVTFDNSLLQEGYQAYVLTNQRGEIVGSAGWLQDILFYVTDRLNLKMATHIIPATSRGWIELENGSWTGGVGVLQKREADICSATVGVTLERASVIDYPLPILHRPCSFIAAIPKGTSLNMWAYVQVRTHLRINFEVILVHINLNWNIRGIILL